MWFWIISGALVGVVLVAAWRFDRRRPGSRISRSEAGVESAIGDAMVRSRRNSPPDLNGGGGESL
ncbi:hypothetical protein [Nocardioides sp.]|uniref:hypothetical protein n=1 Tax=Nocardioides sp. TaxID=35761 RepID=UPI002C0581E2|nr:hypothetical protein [Nocardioides sp.]HSX68981.1 hypothetical protein [Nocardioides sp.]